MPISLNDAAVMQNDIVNLRQAWASPLHLELRASRRLRLLFIAVHLLTLASLVPMSIPLWLQLGTALAVVISLRHVLRRYVWLNDPLAIRAVDWRCGEGWTLTTAEGELLDVELLPGTSVLGPLVILHCRSRGSIRDLSVPLLADMLDEADFRRLRARLRWGSVPDS